LIVAGVGWYWWRHRDTDANRIGTLTVTQLVGRKNELSDTDAGLTHDFHLTENHRLRLAEGKRQRDF
jgi:hypothetical protein